MSRHANVGKPPQEMRTFDVKAGCRPVLLISPCPLAHELRNGLSIVVGNCDLLTEKIESEELRLHLDAISRAAWDMAEFLTRCERQQCQMHSARIEHDLPRETKP